MVSECDRLILSFSRAAATEDEYLGAADFEAFVSCAADGGCGCRALEKIQFQIIH